MALSEEMQMLEDAALGRIVYTRHLNGFLKTFVCLCLGAMALNHVFHVCSMLE